MGRSAGTIDRGVLSLGKREQKWQAREIQIHTIN
jgi:hypothetical protein